MTVNQYETVPTDGNFLFRTLELLLLEEVQYVSEQELHL